MDSPAIGRIREDIQAGRLWKARDRARGLFAARPTDPDVLALTAEVYFRMGDLPRAGAFWYLTNCLGTEVDLAMAAMRERYPRACDVVGQLPIRDRIESFPQPVQSRLRALQAAVKEETGRDWVPAPRTPGSAATVEYTSSRLLEMGCVLVATFVVITFAIGLGNVVGWFISNF